MKQLTCEMCGSTELVKQDGVFVCQSCGTKYSVEEAKRMMVEGTVDVQGTVKIDMSEKLQNLYQVARRAKDDNDNETAAKYYDMILMEDPASWEASFYSVYFRSMSCTIGQIPSAASSIAKCLSSVLTLIKQSGATEEGIQVAVTEIYEKSINAASTFLIASANSFCNIRTDHPAQFVPDLSSRSFASADVAYTLGTAINNLFNDKAWAQKLVSSAYTTGNTLLSSFITVMRPRSFLETAPIHGAMESEANRIISNYKSKISESNNKEKQLIAEEERIAAEKQAARNSAYWEAHATEKSELERRLAELNKNLESYERPKADYEVRIAEFLGEANTLTPAETERNHLQSILRDLQNQRASLGIFKGKEKKALQAQIDETEVKLSSIQSLAAQQRADLQANIQRKIYPIQQKLDEILEQIHHVEDEINEIKTELTRDR